MAAEALRVLAHVAALGTGLRRGNQAGEDALVASNWSLENGSCKLHQHFFSQNKKKETHATEVNASHNYLCNISQNCRVAGGAADRRHSHRLGTDNHSQRSQSTTQARCSVLY